MTTPAIVWMVREQNGDCSEPIALKDDEQAALTMAARLRAQGRDVIVERWEVPGLE